MNALDYLWSLERHGVKLGLDNIRRLLQAAGDPHRTYPTLHVAGTNGKGSTVAVAAAAAAAAGYRVGRFTSPHLLRVNERFLIGTEPIADEALGRHLAFFREIAEKMAFPPTFFEMTTAVAFRWFHECGVDLAIIEVGLGGRLDSTNVVEPAATAITNIDLEHTAYLGPTIAHIAAEKAGIIKHGVPLVTGNLCETARAVIHQTASEHAAPVAALGRDYRYTLQGGLGSQQFSYAGKAWELGPVPLALNGRYQGENAAVAVALLEQVRGQFPRLDITAVCNGLATVKWPCRLEKVLDAPPVYIDVAHNPAGAQRLAAEFSRAVIVLAASSDKDVQRMVQILSPIAATFIYTQFSGARALPAAQLAEIAGVPGTIVPDLAEAIEAGRALASPETPLLITGSIFCAGEARAILMARHGADAPAF